MQKLKKNNWVIVPAGAEYIDYNYERLADGKYSHVRTTHYMDYDRAFRIHYIGEYKGDERVWLHDSGGFLPEVLTPIDSVDAKILNYRQDFKDAEDKWLHRKELHTAEPWRYSLDDKPRINWDESWDGLLLDRIQKLRDAGFEVTDFWRKQKIKMRKPKDMTHGEIVAKIIAAVGDEFTGITFKPGVSVWWGATTRKWW